MEKGHYTGMRSEEEKKLLRQRAKAALKNYFTEDKKPVKQDISKKEFGVGRFGR